MTKRSSNYLFLICYGFVSIMYALYLYCATVGFSDILDSR